MKLLTILTISLLSFFALAQGAPEVVETGKSLLENLDKVDKAIPLELAGWVLMAVTLLIEILVRVVPSAQPRSVLLVAALALQKLSSIFLKSSGLLDKVVQRKK